jgi:hypothetical protein
MGWCRKDKNLIISTKYMGKFIDRVYILKHMGEKIFFFKNYIYILQYEFIYGRTLRKTCGSLIFTYMLEWANVREEVIKTLPMKKYITPLIEGDESMYI